jgi:hypothetical protein
LAQYKSCVAVRTGANTWVITGAIA